MVWGTGLIWGLFAASKSGGNLLCRGVLGFVCLGNVLDYSSMLLKMLWQNLRLLDCDVALDIWYPYLMSLFV